ncbi:MAG: hypothetical protein SNJ70_10050 [Armatimonadota bacterium]
MGQEQIVVQKYSFLGAKDSQEDVLKLLDRLEELAEDSFSLFGRAWGLSLEEFHMLLNKVRASLPDEVRRAKRVANDSDTIVSAAKEEAELLMQQANAEADKIVEEARQVAAKMVDTTEISRLAKTQANDIVANAEAEAREIKRGADEYAKDVLIAIENHIAQVMGTVRKGREKLENRIEARKSEDPIVSASVKSRR